MIVGMAMRHIIIIISVLIFGPSLDSVIYINTTFSNELGGPGSLYPTQSYPGTYPTNNVPRAGAYLSALPGACSLKNLANGSTLYKIERTIDHTASTFTLKCLDQLKEMGVADRKCDESWSVDNINITAVQ